MIFRRGIVGGEEVSEAPFSHNFTDFFRAGGVKGLIGTLHIRTLPVSARSPTLHPTLLKVP